MASFKGFHGTPVKNPRCMGLNQKPTVVNSAFILTSVNTYRNGSSAYNELSIMELNTVFKIFLNQLH